MRATPIINTLIFLLVCTDVMSQSVPREHKKKRITLSYNNTPLITIVKELTARYGYGYILPAEMTNMSVSIEVTNVKLKQVLNELSGKLPIICSCRDSVIFIQAKPVMAVIKDTNHHSVLISILPQVTVHTGYQDIPVEQVTGSFRQANMKQVTGIHQFNLLDRFANNLSGYLRSPRKTTNSTNLPFATIRGQNTIMGNTEPLLIMDHFPFYGDVNLLNPDDIENITVAKDASSTAIYGARAANGIILMTTKKASWKQPFRMSFTSFFTCSNRPDVSYTPSVRPEDYISLESKLFEDHFYAPFEYRNVPLSPVIETLIDYKKGHITHRQLDSTLNVFKSQDVRSDIEKYFYRNALTRHTSIQFSGRQDSLAYYASMSNGCSSFYEVGNKWNRITMLGNIQYRHKVLSIITSLFYSGNTILNNFVAPPTSIPYLQLADPTGRALAVPYQYRSKYLDTAGSYHLLDWHYRPLQELRNANNDSRYRYLMANTKIDYQLSRSLQLQALYQFGSLALDQKIEYNLETYFARNLINSFTQVTPAGIIRPIPPAPMLDEQATITHINNWRLQGNYRRQWKANELTMIGGFELQNTKSRFNSRLVYDHNAQVTKTPLDYQTFYFQYAEPGIRRQIPTAAGRSDSTDYYVSYFGNVFYTWSKKTTLSFSLRQDQSNRFGSNVNRQFIPLWAAGALVHLYTFNFFPASFPYISLRGTIGKTGNDGLKTSWSTTIRQVNDFTNNLPLAYIDKPGNPDLQFEEMRSINIGLDVKTRDRRIQLNLDAYLKKANKLLSYSQANPTSGVDRIKSNSGRLSGFGIDANVHTINVKNPFTWETNGWLSYTTNKVRSRELLLDQAWKYADAGTYAPRKGYPVNAIFAFPMGGLDQSGDPVGYLNGAPSKNYGLIIASPDPQTLRYIGSATPTLFGCITNTLQYKGIILFFQLTGKFNYYYRRTSLNALDLYQGTLHEDYYKRWQQPGDEKRTMVPALHAFVDDAREIFYKYSEVLVEKGDHIRLQNLQLLYNWDNKKLFGLPFNRLQTGITLNNAGIIWQATYKKLDPDVTAAGMLPDPRSITVSITACL